jgi:asparagine N-glycosylation enzyme membrane subunit Stt3
MSAGLEVVCVREHSLSRSARYALEVGKDRKTMLSTLIVILVILWLLGMLTSYTLGGFIHILLVIAIVVVLLRIIQGRNPLRG